MKLQPMWLLAANLMLLLTLTPGCTTPHDDQPHLVRQRFVPTPPTETTDASRCCW